MDIETEQLVRRALGAWYRSDCDGEYDPVVLTPPISGVAAEHAGKRYVLIVNGPGVPVAVYRVRNDGALKSLRQWPRALHAALPRPGDDGIRIAVALLAAEFRDEPDEVMNLLMEEGRPCLDHVVRMLLQLTAGAVRQIAGPGAPAEELARMCSAHAVRLAAEQDRADPEPGAS
jgi:hypothetical protein